MNDPRSDSAIDEFVEAVRAIAPGELEVTSTDAGFGIAYAETLVQHGILLRIEQTYCSVVTCDPVGRTFVMEDRGMVRRSELGGTSRSVSGARGRLNAWAQVTLWGENPDGSWGEVGTQKQDTRVLHAAVRGAAEELGWIEKQPAAANVGKLVAGIVVAGFVLAGVVVAALALTGGFG
ncbi:hypothetical protein [Microbacterium sp. C7(2022)]|uniref:hypothetical protein n=1 Tax=Microbacterium sp. C7(2022) TaxID=2992759 RepID=UPI00237C3927|nr:hypothetical protein [Microbacterium sp. C7(2022)]MDE0547625.1 hypothetical protein [Microbacterium sp. C7(2022)]